MMDNKIPLSVVIITKDEEKNIGDALESVKDFEDIVVVDSFSKDRTVEICRKYTERVFQHEWQGYARQKQTAVDYARKQWVLILDSDERITSSLRSEIIAAIGNSTHNGFYVPRKNFFLGKWIKHSGWWPDYALRLFKKDVSYVEPREVHEKVIVSGSTGYMKEPLEHYTYRTLSDYMKKMEIYSTLAAKELCNRKNVSPISMLINPVLVFIKMFFLRQGFRDGKRGFLLAVLYTFQNFLKYAKAWEINKFNL